MSNPAQPGPFTLTATNSIGATRQHELQADQGVFVGSGSNCGLQLNGSDISDIHCRIGIENGKAWVQDWMSAEGTRVNGQAISSNVELLSGDVVQVGEHQITVASGSASGLKSKSTPDRLDGQEHLDVPTRCEPTENDCESHRPAPTCSHHVSANDDAAVENCDGDRCHDVPASSEANGEESSLGEDANTGASTGKNTDVNTGTTIDVAATENRSESIDLESDFFDFQEEETYDRETVALLHAEIEHLQSALAQQDAERECNETVDLGDPEIRNADEPDEVLNRMQELIDEANGSDERVAILEEMLYAAEEANRSEQEERNQLEAWVGDIEKRVGQREDEHVAELEALRQRLETSDSEKEQLQQRLRQAAQTGSAPKQYEQTLDHLQASNKQLQDELAESKKQRLTLEQRLEQASGSQEETLRGERAELAKEQAKISRLRFELSSKMSAIETVPKNENQADKETAHRIKALREHLREIHAQEKEEAKEASLGTRLANLWKRVEY